MTDFAGLGDDAPASDIGWQPDIPVGDSVTLPPDPHIMDAIGRNHRLETAVADLVDNAIDAGAGRVLIRFVIANHRVQSFYVVDDGQGMTRDDIDSAMRVGGRRAYGEAEIGHFGLGLKAASFSQANSLTVISIANESLAVGRRWLASKASQSFECDVVADGFARHELQRPWGFVRPQPGTVIRWDEIRVFPSGRDDAITSRFVTDASTRLQHHLGLVFHRFLERDQIKIGIDIEDVAAESSGPVIEVHPLDPFGYVRSGAAGFPKELQTDVRRVSVSAVCHVWPGRSQQAQFRLPGGTPESHQGLYFYRRDRLLQPGGWNNIEVQHRDLQLARVGINLPDGLVEAGVFRLNPEKSRVESGHEFSEALREAKSPDGTTFDGYLNVAREAFKQSNRRIRARASVVPLGRGVPPRLRRTLQRELTSLPGHEEIDLRWRSLTDDVLFDINRDEHTIWLNTRYRDVVSGPGHAAFNDAALVKIMLFLLVENLFHGAYWGPKDKDNLELWQTLLTAAVKEELD